MALNTAVLAIWPLITRLSTSGQPRYARSSFRRSRSTSWMKPVPW